MSQNDDLISRQAAINALDKEYRCTDQSDDWGGLKTAMLIIENLPSVQPEQQCGRIFQGIVVEYPEYCIYPEYKGKPYFSIKYTENGQEFIGYSTYKLEVLSEYLKEYFMPPAQPERKKGCKIVKSTGTYGYCACDQCGKPVHPEDRFCSKCGADFREEDA